MKHLNFNFKSIVRSKARWLLTIIAILTLGVGQMWADNFTNGEVIFIYADKNSAWDASACVKAWFHNSGNNAVSTYWLFDKSVDGGTEKMFYCVVPASGTYSECQLQRFASNCTDWWNSNGDIAASSRTSGYNTFYSNGSGTANCGWKGTYTMYLKGSTDSWASNLATFSFSSGTTFTASYDFTAAATSYDFKMCDSYGNWHGSNVTVSGLVVGAKYRFTGTINLANGIGSLSMSKTQLTFAIATSATNGSVSPTSAFVGSSGVAFEATPSTGYHWSSWGTTSGLTATNANPTSLTATAAGTLTANFAANTYALTLKKNGGSTDGSVTATYNSSSLTSFSGASRTGYTCNGYYSAKTSGSKIINSNGTIPSSTVTNYLSSGKWVGDTVTILWAYWDAKTYTITLDGNGGSDGEVTTTYDSDETSDFSEASYAGYSCDGYFTDDEDGDMIIDASGDLVADVEGWTDEDGNWVKDAAEIILYAHWTENASYYDVTFAVGSDYTSLGSLSAKVTSTSAAISSGDDLVGGTGITFTATPETGYIVEGWYTDEDCTEGMHDAGNNTYSIASLSSDVTVYVKFVEKTWSVAFAAGTGGSVTTPAATPQTVGQLTGISIAATPSSGYTFNTWTITSGSGSFTSSASTNSNKFKPTANSTITASFNETMRDITIVGGHVYNSASTSTTAGVATAAKITANDPATGKKFTGWTLGTGVSLKAGYTLTNQTIEIYSTADATVTANYADRASVKMYFAKPTTMGWSKVYAYAWKSTDASVRNAAYPGVELDETEVVNNIVYYVYQYYTEADGIGGTATGNSAWDRVIFGDNDDARKTADLTIADRHYYYMKSSTTGSGSAIANAWFIKGTMNSWGEDNPIAHDRSTNSGTVTINLEKDIQYEFKVYDQVSDTMWSNSEALGGITNSVDATTLYNNDLNVMKITPNKTGAYVFTITNTNTTAPKIAVDYPSQYLVGSWDSWDEDDHMFDANGYVRVYLTTSKDPYQFQVKYNGRWYGAKGAGTITSTTKDWGFSVSDGSDYNVSITIGTDGYYVFGWNGKDKKISVIYPADTTKAQLAPSKYIYFDARNLTADGWWINEFSTRFWLKNYASGVDITHVDCDIVDTVENKVFYALVPAEGQVGQVHLNRMKPDFTAIWSTPNKVHAVDRANTDQNCLKEETGKEGYFEGWTPQWTKYCPPMTSATLTAVNAADKTVIYGGSGTKADPYIVATRANIYVLASSVSKLNDANMEAQYRWYKTNVAESALYNNSTTHIYEANSSNNVTDSMTVDAKNYYSSTYGRVSPRSNAIYYTARTPYNVAIYEYNVTKTSGATGSKGAVNNVAYVATFTADEGYNLPTLDGVVVSHSSVDITANCTWSVLEGVGTLTVPAAYVTADLAISVYGVLKTYDITYSGGTYGSGTLDGGTKTHGEDYELSDNSTAFTREGYAYDGWATSDGGDKAYNFGGSYTTNAAQTFYPHWVEAYSVTHSLTNVSTASGATGSIAGVSGYNYVATFTADAGYALPSTIGVTVGGAAKTQGTHFTWSVSDGVGTLTITSTYVTGAIVITITGTPVTLTWKGGFGWDNTRSWDPACIPTIEHDVIIDKSCRVEVADAQAKSVTIHHYGDKEGCLSIYTGVLSTGALLVAEDVKAIHEEDGAREATTQNDLKIYTNSNGNGGLICGDACPNTNAQYIFYSRVYRFGSYYINQYVGIPFTSMDPYQWYGVNIFEYDPKRDDWMTPGESELKPDTCYNIISKYSGGYTIFYTNGELDLPGTSGKKTLTCGSRYGAAFNGDGDYMFANSWTAPISVGALTASDVDGILQEVHIFNAGFVSKDDSAKIVGDLAGQWTAISFAAAPYIADSLTVIPATQAFCVTATKANAKLTLDYGKHVYTPAYSNGRIITTPTRAPRHTPAEGAPSVLQIKVQRDSVTADHVYVFEREDFTNGYDNGWDATKLFGETYAPQIYGIQGEGKTSINAIPNMEGVRIGFKAGTDTNAYTLSFEYNDDEPLYLYDKETNAYIEITNEATYEFTTTDRKAHERFLLTRSNSPQIATGVEEIDTENVQRAQKFMQDQQIFIRRGDKVYSIDGALVK